MKKSLLVSVPILLLLLIGCIYWIVPSNYTPSSALIVKSNIASANRFILDTAKWDQWWPDTGDARITGIFYNHLRISIPLGNDSPAICDMRIAQLNQDSILVGWFCNLSPGIDPVSRLAAWRRGKRVSGQMDRIMKSFQTFMENDEKVYGARFVHAMSSDSTLVTITSVTSGYPSTDYVYRVIDSLRSYVQNKGARIANYPMMNVTRLDSNNNYKSIIALAIDRELPGSGRIIPKRFVPWKMIEAEIHGGIHTIENGFIQMYHYRDDHHLSIMGLPFQSIITDRRQQADTTKWVTRVCAPIS